MLLMGESHPISIKKQSKKTKSWDPSRFADSIRSNTFPGFRLANPFYILCLGQADTSPLGWVLFNDPCYEKMTQVINSRHQNRCKPFGGLRQLRFENIRDLGWFAKDQPPQYQSWNVFSPAKNHGWV